MALWVLRNVVLCGRASQMCRCELGKLFFKGAVCGGKKEKFLQRLRAGSPAIYT